MDFMLNQKEQVHSDLTIVHVTKNFFSKRTQYASKLLKSAPKNKIKRI